MKHNNISHAKTQSPEEIQLTTDNTDFTGESRVVSTSANIRNCPPPTPGESLPRFTGRDSGSEVFLTRDSGFGTFIRAIKAMVFIVLLFSSTLPAYSQNDSLHKYLETAIENNPVVQQKFSEYRAALQKVPQAGALPDPEFNISYFLMPMELVSGRQFAEMNLMQMFPWFGVLKNAKDEMTNMAYAEFEEYRDAGLQVVYDVQSAWYDLYRVRKTAGITRKNIEILKTIEDLSLTRYRTPASGAAGNSPAPLQNQSSAGSGSQPGSSMQGMNNMGGGQSGSAGAPSRQTMQMSSQMEQSSGSGLADLYRLKMESADLENAIRSLEDQEKVLTARINILLSRKPDVPVFVPDSLSAFTQVNDLNPDSVSHSGNPMLAMIEYEKKAYAAREKMAEKMGLPMVGLGLGYSIMGQNEMTEGEMPGSMGGEDMIMPMVSVSIPIWRKKYKAARREAEILSESAVQRYESASDNLWLEHNEALRSYRDAQRRLDLYSGQKTLASNTLELLQTRLSVSSANLTDILRVQQQLLDYEVKEVEAVTDLNKSAALLNRITAASLNDLKLKNTEQ